MVSRHGASIRASLIATGVSLAGLLLSGCGESVPPPDETVQPRKVETPKAVENAAKKAGRPIPKSIKDRS